MKQNTILRQEIGEISDLRSQASRSRCGFSLAVICGEGVDEESNGDLFTYEMSGLQVLVAFPWSMLRALPIPLFDDLISLSCFLAS